MKLIVAARVNITAVRKALRVFLLMVDSSEKVSLVFSFVMGVSIIRFSFCLLSERDLAVFLLHSDRRCFSFL